jgi:DNA-binding PadR family transcriptional regulator
MVVQSPVRLTVGVQRVLRELENGERFGQELAEPTQLASGVVYTILNRLHSSGLIAKRVEDGDATQLKRPLRIFYRLTDLGLQIARTHIELARPEKQ